MGNVMNDEKTKELHIVEVRLNIVNVNFNIDLKFNYKVGSGYISGIRKGCKLVGKHLLKRKDLS